MPSPGTPLWPAGHLPLKGGNRVSIANIAERMPTQPQPISPLEGEMPGRAEGGAS
ncbi:lytic murein transglycosylase [Mesorhizobium sp. M3A.F.Ca.ET.174.01.1.1]|nr:lytic murein transglycosylase [Mesorhizobium sp. M3A.F.Ca.ET.080.04.2.1]PBB87994.1 lytic murein transglycosylase [Mesorhizobium sp. WSM3876]RWB69129.1 MAG: lytic murein transglycosylase [Mesorhizobium sp.]TGS69095.1 lytic murein transglycosylase [Mesorhizobium sp. M3A.F.Ca.ET.201.01.1.1]TGS86962.1 lytic murein transglycosylase [Mesorhizobium sp. M3A.F.Ca.ET.175.01.1.1]TGT26793.1 lytic murein transglycosylase [Mesorhizobium sp. M3A.F.Ca.ET.174.01.1.1]TGT60423.1 lytic murein transglycosylase